jgi:hypothetical protein
LPLSELRSNLGVRTVERSYRYLIEIFQMCTGSAQSSVPKGSMAIVMLSEGKISNKK